MYTYENIVAIVKETVSRETATVKELARARADNNYLLHQVLS